MNVIYSSSTFQPWAVAAALQLRIWSSLDVGRCKSEE